MKNLLCLIAICLTPSLAFAEASIVPAKTQLVVPNSAGEAFAPVVHTLDADYFLLDQADFRQVLIMQKDRALFLDAADAKPCVGEETALEWLGWTGVILIGLGSAVLSGVTTGLIMHATRQD